MAPRMKAVQQTIQQMSSNMHAPFTQKASRIITVAGGIKGSPC